MVGSAKPLERTNIKPPPLIVVPSVVPPELTIVVPPEIMVMSPETSPPLRMSRMPPLSTR
jgi:hypothetical protein